MIRQLRLEASFHTIINSSITIIVTMTTIMVVTIATKIIVTERAVSLCIVVCYPHMVFISSTCPESESYYRPNV